MLPSNPTPTVRQVKVFERHHIELIDMHEVSQKKHGAGGKDQQAGWLIRELEN